MRNYLLIFQILRVLKGEPYSSITESSSESVAHVTDKMSSLRFISKDSGQGSMGICSSGLYSMLILSVEIGLI